MIADRAPLTLALHRPGGAIIAHLSDNALDMPRCLSPALVLVNLPNGDLTPRLLRRLGRPGIPLVLVQDAAHPIPGPADQDAPFYVLSRPVRSGDLQAAL